MLNELVLPNEGEAMGGGDLCTSEVVDVAIDKFASPVWERSSP